MDKHKPSALWLLAGILIGSALFLAALYGARPVAATTLLEREGGNPLSFVPLILKNWSAANLPGGEILISEVYYDPSGNEPEEEWIEIYNPGPDPVDLSEFKIGDEETPGGGEGMYRFPKGASMDPGELVLIANKAASFKALYGFAPDFEFRESDPDIPTLVKYSSWAGGLVVLLNTSDEVLVMDGSDELVDAVSWGSSTFAFDPPAPDVPSGHSLERSPAYRDTDSAADWIDRSDPAPGVVDLSTPTPLPTPTASDTPIPSPTVILSGTPTSTGQPSPSPTMSLTPGTGLLLISEALYDPSTDEPDGEWIEIYNAGPSLADLALYKLGDEETQGGGEGMYRFPDGSVLESGSTAVIANSAAVFFQLYGFSPDYELSDSDPVIPDMVRYLDWAGGNISLGNSGDEVLLLDGMDILVDALSWGNSTFAFDPPAPDVAEGHSLERVPADVDTDTASDWQDQPIPDPGNVVLSPLDSTGELQNISEGESGPRRKTPTPTQLSDATPTARPTQPAPMTRTPFATTPPLTPSPDASFTPHPATTTATLPPQTNTPTTGPPTSTATAIVSPTASATPSPPTNTPSATAMATFTPSPLSTNTPGPTPSPSPTPSGVNYLLVSEVFYDTPGSDPSEEWIEIYNPTTVVFDLSGYKLGDEETQGGSEGMYQFPPGAFISPGGRVVVALQATGFFALYGFNPDFEVADTDPAVGNMIEYSAWGSGAIAMSNSGDEILLLDEGDNPVDVVTYEGGSYPGVIPHPGVPSGLSIERIPAGLDTDDCSVDFIGQQSPTPGN